MPVASRCLRSKRRKRDITTSCNVNTRKTFINKKDWLQESNNNAYQRDSFIFIKNLMVNVKPPVADSGVKTRVFTSDRPQWRRKKSRIVYGWEEVDTTKHLGQGNEDVFLWECSKSWKLWFDWFWFDDKFDLEGVCGGRIHHAKAR